MSAEITGVLLFLEIYSSLLSGLSFNCSDPADHSSLSLINITRFPPWGNMKEGDSGDAGPSLLILGEEVVR